MTPHNPHRPVPVSATPPVPPWIAFPELHTVSMGWRMGGGEAHLNEWSAWAARRTEEELYAYFAAFQPVPFYWGSFVLAWLGGPRVDEHRTAELLGEKGLKMQTSLQGAITEAAKMIGDPGPLNARRVRATVTTSCAGTPTEWWDRVVNADLTQILTGTRLLPAVTNVFDFGHWGVTDLRRSLTLSDGSTLNEIVVEASAPRRLAYRIYGITGRFGTLTNGADAEFILRESVEGTTIQWTYDYDSTNPLTHPAVVFIIKRLWQPYMSEVLERLVRQHST